LYIIYVTGESYIDHSYTIARELKKHLRLDIYFSSKEVTGEVSFFLKTLNAVYVKRQRFRNVFSIFKELRFILKLRRANADCVWFNTLNVYQVWLVKHLLKKYIVMVHDVELHPETGEKHGNLSVKLTLKKYPRNICVASNSQAEVFEKQFGFKPKVFRLPVIDYYRDIAANTEKKRADGKIRFFFFGSIEKYKGLETLLEAVEILNKKDLEFDLNIYGRLKYNEEEFLEKINVLKNVNLVNKFIDYKEIHNIYITNDVIILPYKQVTQCGPLLIGYSENTPAIVSRHPGFTEYTDNGNSALVFENTAESLAEKMQLCINDPRVISRMREFIGTEIKNRFSMQSLAEEYINNFKI